MSSDDCGHDGVCAEAPGCSRHWAERAREVMAERDDARAELKETQDDFQSVWESRDKVIAERERARQACNAYWHDLVRIALLCAQTDDEYPLKAVERTVRDFAKSLRERDEALAQVARREREHEALVETAQKALATIQRERDEAHHTLGRIAAVLFSSRAPLDDEELVESMLMVIRERDELRHKLAGEAKHIESLEGLRVDALRERDALRSAMTLRYSLSREIEEILGVTGAEASDEQLALGVAAARRIVRERDEFRAQLAFLREEYGVNADNGTLTRDALEQKIQVLVDERRQLRARLVECRPWVGVCPFPNQPGFSEMLAIRALADDALEEVKP